MDKIPYKYVDLTGLVFGMLTVLDKVPDTNGPAGTAVWLCRCECGNTIQVASALLRDGKTKNCGCKIYSPGKEKPYRHHMTGSPVYGSWANMVARCNNVKNPAYGDYGGRGIKVCERWLDFRNFFDDMGDRPEGHTLDRIDPNGDYCKENCRWATISVQNKNRRPSKVSKLARLLHAYGETKT